MKHPVPKRKQSKSRSARRYKTFANGARVKLAESTPLVACSTCGAKKRNHHVCLSCGKYNGKKVISMEKKVSKKITKVKA